jgi:hypothetical protein
MSIVKYLRFMVVDASAVFRSGSDLTIKLLVTPHNSAIKLKGGKSYYSLDKDEIKSKPKSDLIEVYISEVVLDVGIGILQDGCDDTLDVVLTESKEQIKEMMRLSFIDRYLSIDIAGDEGQRYIESNFVLEKDYYSVASWSIELPF